mmetsp:Transcript_9397/g.18056  ORF Transcript_9397/g.18056 Transcript_9397/m.18056 type:complete len:92 (-) Transcript_9397:1337-1612(-)
MADRKAVIKLTDMSDEILQDAIEVAVQAFEKATVLRDIAASIKKDFDRRYGPSWHCIVGQNFGSFVTHQAQHFVYFFIDETAVLLFRSISQ